MKGSELMAPAASETIVGWSIQSIIVSGLWAAWLMSHAFSQQQMNETKTIWMIFMNQIVGWLNNIVLAMKCSTAPPLAASAANELRGSGGEFNEWFNSFTQLIEKEWVNGGHAIDSWIESINVNDWRNEIKWNYAANGMNCLMKWLNQTMNGVGYEAAASFLFNHFISFFSFIKLNSSNECKKAMAAPLTHLNFLQWIAFITIIQWLWLAWLTQWIKEINELIYFDSIAVRQSATIL